MADPSQPDSHFVVPAPWAENREDQREVIAQSWQRLTQETASSRAGSLLDLIVVDSAARSVVRIDAALDEPGSVASSRSRRELEREVVVASFIRERRIQ
jgi:hypothetical protein